MTELDTVHDDTVHVGAVHAGYDPDVAAERIALVDLLDRVLAGGVVVAGDITLSIADVDLVTVSLRALLSSVSALASRAESSDAGR
jgi:hypothetical protein